MATMTIRMPDSKHDRLRRLAESHGVSLNKLVDEWASMALAQFDAETARFAPLAEVLGEGWRCSISWIRRRDKKMWVRKDEGRSDELLDCDILQSVEKSYCTFGLSKHGSFHVSLLS
jgi:hypothetical protein